MITNAKRAQADNLRARVLAHLAAYPDAALTAFEVARTIGAGTSSARTTLRRLADDGLVDVITEPDPTLGARVSTRYRAASATAPQQEGPEVTTGHHRGRSWTGHDLEDTCPCPKEPCGLINLAKADADCVQHGRNQPPRSMRQGHTATDCPGGTDPTTVLRLAYEALRNAAGRCPTHNLTPPETGECDGCAQARRVRRAVFAFDVALDTPDLQESRLAIVSEEERSKDAALKALLERAWRKQYDPDIQEIAEILGWDDTDGETR